MYVLQMKIKSKIRLDDGQGNTDNHVQTFDYESTSQVTFPSNLKGEQIANFCRGWLFNANIGKAFQPVYSMLYKKLSEMKFSNNNKFSPIINYTDEMINVKISYKWIY